MYDIITLENAYDLSPSYIYKSISVLNNSFPFEGIIYTNITKFVFNYNPLLFTNYYSPSFFIEGIENEDIHLNIEMIDGQYIGYKTGQVIDNNFITLQNIPIERYKIYNQNNTWFKIIERNQTMIRGFINGIVDVQKCNTSEEFLFIKCFRRTDNVFIGEYKVTAGTYTIPNLDVNEEYDIVLFDKSMTLEQQVSSKRIPRPY